MKYRSLKVSFILLIAFLLLSVSQSMVTAEDIELEDSSGYFGIYIDGVKVGFSSWTLKKKTVSKKDYYRIEMEESRTIKEKLSTYKYNGTIKKDLSLKSLECEIKKGSRCTKIKCRESGGSVSVNTTTGSSKIPPQKVKVGKNTMWNYCAHLSWAWKNLPSDKPAEFSRLISQGGSVLKCDLTPSTKTITFEEDKVDCVEWVDEEHRVLIQTDGNGKLYNYVTTTKRGKKTEYICESEKVAKSPGKFEDFDGEEEGDKKEVAKGKVEGDDEGLFDGCLTPVKDKADESEEGEYLKVDNVFSIKAMEDWECFKGATEDEESRLWRIVSDDNSKVKILSFHTDTDEDVGKIDPESDYAKKQAEGLAFMVMLLFTMGRRGNINMFTKPSCNGIYKFPDDSYLFGVKSSGTNVAIGTKYKIQGVMGQNDDYSVFALAMVPEDDWDDVSEDVYKMLGSFRAID